jgi:hypothetical protein
MYAIWTDFFVYVSADNGWNQVKPLFSLRCASDRGVPVVPSDGVDVLSQPVVTAFGLRQPPSLEPLPRRSGSRSGDFSFVVARCARVLLDCFACVLSFPAGCLDLKLKSGNSLIVATKGGELEPMFQGKMNCGRGIVCAPEAPAFFALLMHRDSLLQRSRSRITHRTELSSIIEGLGIRRLSNFAHCHELISGPAPAFPLRRRC